MGRYCFYCGKQLEPGESCDCRYAQENAKKRNQNKTKQASTSSTGSSNSANSSSTGSSSTSGGSTSTSNSGTSQTSSSSTQSGGRKRNENFQAYQESREEHNSKQANKDKKKNTGEDFFKSVFSRTKNTNGDSDSSSSSERVKAKRERTDNPKFSDTLKNIFTSPSQVIRDASYSSLLVTVLVYLVASALFALVMTVFFRNSNLIRLVVLQDSGFSSNAIIRETNALFFRSFILGLVISFARIGIYYLLIKLFGRQKIEFKSLWKIFLPGTYYEILLLAVSLLLANGTGMQGLIMLVAALAIRAIIDTSSIRYHFSLSNDKLIWCSVLSLVLLFVAISLLLNLAAPSIANFNVVPFNGGNNFIPNA